MTIGLGASQYGKAETRLVRVYRHGARHEIRDVSVTTTLRGDFTAAHTLGDQSRVLPTDSQKNTVFAYAREKEAGEIEDYALELARHFAADIAPVREARVEVEEYRWDRITADGQQHPHAFVRSGQDIRTTAVTVRAGTGARGGTGPGGGTGAAGQAGALCAWVVSGLTGLVLLKSTGSEFAGFLKDRYTTLEETSDRILATSLTARWRYAAPQQPPDGWAAAHAAIRQTMLERFATVHSKALQQTLWEMGRAVLEARPEVAEISLSAPNKHHFLVDLRPFGLDNPGEVYHAADRPYGLIQAAVRREGAPPPGPAWQSPAAFT
jgi:urate oxidase